MSTLRFERLAEGHIESVVEIEKDSNSSPWSAGAFRNELVNPQSHFLVAILEGAVAGYGGYWRCIDEAHVTNVAVALSKRRQGVARKLMNRLLSDAIDEGMVCSTLEVRASNEAAINLYEGLGYKVAARRKGYYPDNREDALVMWLYGLEK